LDTKKEVEQVCYVYILTEVTSRKIILWASYGPYFIISIITIIIIIIII